jgi:hypothetical protein
LSTTTAIKERPILFAAPMVRAILEGRKTQTRRVVKKQPPSDCNRHCWFDAPIYGWTREPEPAGEWHKVSCPYGIPGERLWVRETFITGHNVDAGELLFRDEDGNDLPETVWYRAENEDFRWMNDDGEMTDKVPWKPSIYMPRRLARLNLEITDVRVQRLREISHEDAVAEGAVEFETGYVFEGTGMDRAKLCHNSAEIAFACLWDEINGKRPGCTWDESPWVWVITFRRVKGGEA